MRLRQSSAFIALASLMVLQAVLVSAGGAAWASEAANIPPAVPPSADTSGNYTPLLARAATAFGFTLFSTVWAAGVPANTLLSTSGVHLALSMTHHGARGTTKEALSKVLGLGDWPDQQVDLHYLALHQNLLHADSSITLKVANGLWCRQGIQFNQDFLNNNQMYFNAHLTALDFQKPDSLQVINSWINERTEGKIPAILDKIDPSAAMFLTNALYFKGPWSAPFSASATTSHAFTLLSGNQIMVPLMQRNGRYKFLSSNEASGIRLPYGNKERFSLYILMPKNNTNFTSFVQALDYQKWRSYLSQFQPGAGWVRLPRFELRYGSNLKTALVEMGLGVAFDKVKANFSGISDTPLSISQVWHKAYIKVDEQGTEAAAATAVEMQMRALPPANDFDLTVDHPFVLVLQDDETSDVLFLGAVVDPR